MAEREVETPEDQPAAPTQKGGREVRAFGDIVDTVAVQPDNAELQDPVKLKALERLRKAVDGLVGASNRYPDLYTVSKDLQDMLRRPFEDMDLLEIHFELEICRGVYNRRGERTGEDIFELEVVSTLERVNMFGPPLTLENEEVKEHERRHAEYAGIKANEMTLEFLNQISASITDNDVVFGGKIRHDSAVLAQGSIVVMDRLRVGQLDLNRNTVITVGLMVLDKLVSGPMGVVGTDLFEWLVQNSGAINELAPGWGDAFRAWISPIMAQAKEALDAAKGIANKRRK
jgi:hypothetical protein